MTDDNVISYTPIGFIHTPFDQPKGMPIQAAYAPDVGLRCSISSPSCRRSIRVKRSASDGWPGRGRLAGAVGWPVCGT